MVQLAAMVGSRLGLLARAPIPRLRLSRHDPLLAIQDRMTYPK